MTKKYSIRMDGDDRMMQVAKSLAEASNEVGDDRVLTLSDELEAQRKDKREQDVVSEATA